MARMCTHRFVYAAVLGAVWLAGCSQDGTDTPVTALPVDTASTQAGGTDSAGVAGSGDTQAVFDTVPSPGSTDTGPASDTATSSGGDTGADTGSAPPDTGSGGVDTGSASTGTATSTGSSGGIDPGVDITTLAPSAAPPAGLAPSQVPQFVSIGFDDNGYSGLDGSGGEGGISWAVDFFKNLKNPDGTPARVSFFVTATYIGDWMSESPVLVKKALRQAYEDGHEIGNHTYSHPHGAGYSAAQWQNEMEQCNQWLTKPFDPNEVTFTPDNTKGVGVPASEILGFRTPFLEYGDATFSALEALGFLYDCSIEEGGEAGQDGTNYYWPYTLDGGSPANPDVGSHPGLWELPVHNVIVPPDDVCPDYGIPSGLRAKLAGVQSWFDAGSGKMVGFDYNWWVQFRMTKEEVLAMLKYTLDLRLQGNRAPMLIGAHTDYYNSKYTAPPNADTAARQAAIEEFIQYAASKPEVRIVPFVNVVRWMQHPTGL